MPPSKVSEPWHAFLTELDSAVSEAVDLHCIGGFVITQLYGFTRPTADIDTLFVTSRNELLRLLEKGRRGSELHKKYGVYLDFVSVADCPYDYDERLSEMFPGVYEHLRLLALDPYDLALTKLSRNIERDREDVKYLARCVPLDLKILKERYTVELRPYIGNPTRHDLTLELWIEMITEERSS